MSLVLRGAVVVLVVAEVLTTQTSSHAQAPPASSSTPSASEVDEARFLFGAGSAKLQVGRATDALPLLEQSFALVPSPNTELLLARALRDVGRRVEALARFEHAASEASRRAAAGEAKYAQSASAAREESATLRGQLGVLVLHVESAVGASVLVDGNAVTLTPDGDASVVHEPGQIEVVVRAAGGEQRQSVTIAPGGTVKLAFGGGVVAAKPPPLLAPLPEPAPTGSWTRPATWIAGGVALAGAGTFTVLGLKSQGTYDELSQRCGPTCGAAERPEADRAEREQTIANVGLAVACTAAVAAIVFFVLSPSAPSARARYDRAR